MNLHLSTSNHFKPLLLESGLCFWGDAENRAWNPSNNPPKGEGCAFRFQCGSRSDHYQWKTSWWFLLFPNSGIFSLSPFYPISSPGNRTLRGFSNPFGLWFQMASRSTLPLARLAREVLILPSTSSTGDRISCSFTRGKSTKCGKTLGPFFGPLCRDSSHSFTSCESPTLCNGHTSWTPFWASL